MCCTQIKAFYYPDCLSFYLLMKHLLNHFNINQLETANKQPTSHLSSHTCWVHVDIQNHHPSIVRNITNSVWDLPWSMSKFLGKVIQIPFNFLSYVFWGVIRLLLFVKPLVFIPFSWALHSFWGHGEGVGPHPSFMWVKPGTRLGMTGWSSNTGNGSCLISWCNWLHPGLIMLILYLFTTHFTLMWVHLLVHHSFPHVFVHVWASCSSTYSFATHVFAT